MLTYYGFCTLVVACITALFFGLTLGQVIFGKRDNFAYIFDTFLVTLIVTILLGYICIKYNIFVY